MGITDSEIARINELYAKSKSTGLTDEEREEQALLRRKYIDSVTGNLAGQLSGYKRVPPKRK